MCSREPSLARTAAFYPEEGIKEFDEIRPVNILFRYVDANHRAQLLRLPENDQVH